MSIKQAVLSNISIIKTISEITISCVTMLWKRRDRSNQHNNIPLSMIR